MNDDEDYDSDVPLRGTFLPGDPTPAGHAGGFLDDHITAGRPLYLAGSGPSDRVELTPQVIDALSTLLECFRSGIAADITPVELQIPIHTAASMLRADERHINTLLDNGTLPHTHNGHQRMVKLPELLAHREEGSQQLHDALMAGYDPDDPLDDDQHPRAKEIRRETRRKIGEQLRREQATTPESDPED